jgi:hypothetical protein
MVEDVEPVWVVGSRVLGVCIRFLVGVNFGGGRRGVKLGFR